MRVYELAKELGIAGKDLLNRCKALGLKAAGNFSGLSDADASLVRAAYGGASRPEGVSEPRERRKKSAGAGVPAAPTGAQDAKPQAGKPPQAPAAPQTPAAPQDPERASARKRRRSRSHRRNVEEDDVDMPLDLPARKAGVIHATPLPSSRKPARKRRAFRRPRRLSALTPAAARPTEATVEVPATVRDVSAAVGVKANQIIYKLMQLGVMANINSPLDADQVELLAQEFKLTIHTRPAASVEQAVEKIEQETDRPEDLTPRAPVVTFLGHVDHGKTSLLDRIRRSDVVSHEHGGITQHIGAYRVTVGDKTVVFIDTPGHEAFTAMRARGANVTDIAVLVVAADDGVMPQTEEAIDHARAADVPIVVALNKCDKPEANPLRAKQQLSNLGLQPEEWGGDTVCVEVSAETGAGVDELVEMLALVAELKELKANATRPARGAVLEAQMTESHGATATVLVEDGTLHVGDVVVAGDAYGRVKALIDDRGCGQKEASPATPVTVIGLSNLPGAGDRMLVMDDIQKARAVAEERRRKMREARVMQRQHVTLENLFDSLEEGALRELLLILKADVRGTLEALVQMVDRITSSEVKVRVLRASAGGVSTSDVLLADASDAIIIGLNVGVDPVARGMAEEKGVSIRVYDVIYRVKDEIERALVGMLKPREKEVVMGHTEVRRIFKISRYGSIAGCYVLDGAVARNHRIRLVRDGAVIHQGRLDSLRREKNDVREVREGFECGMHIDGYDDIKVGDVIETFRVEQIARTLDDAEEPAEA